ncbi:MAG TPA: hypothetical protein VEU29_06010 [Actinomycetota bacterium]|nr:hypothetical protein [Actinomycetota bacterium]
MENRDPGRPRSRRTEPAGLAPVRAFLAVGTAATVIVALLAATREAEPREPTPAPARSPDYTLTDAEAIAEFERLNAQLIQAYEERNIALAESVFTEDSPMLPRVRKEIDALIRSAALSRTTFTAELTEVARNEGNEVVIRRIEIVRPKFETESGQDATAAGRPHRQELNWTLRLQESTWMLHKAVIVNTDPLRGQGA